MSATSTCFWLYYNTTISTAVSELQTIVVATNTVIDRLGTEVSEIMKWYLRHNFAICLEPDCLFAVEEVGIALQRLVGETEARSIMQEIRQEMADITSMQKRATRQRKNAFTFWVTG
jgi:hypothetical protein